jgi:hypothetical protein
MERIISSARALVTLGLLMALSAPASGQAPPVPAGAGAGADADVARLYREGVKAADQKQWEQARHAFQEAWKRKPHYQIAANLGRAELRAGKPRDAVEHLTYFLREAPEDVRPEDRAEAQALLSEARAQIGTVALRVDPPDAEVLLDGAPPASPSGAPSMASPALGGAPPAPGAASLAVARELPVDPGRRVVEARREGYRPARQEVDVPPGGRVQVALHLEPLAQGGPAPPPAEGGGRSPVVIGVGIGASVAAAGAGVVLVVLGVGKSSELDDFPAKHGGYPASARDEWLGLQQSRADLLNAGTWGLIGAGVLAGATTAYVLTGSTPSAQPQKAGPIRLYPVGTGIAVSGRW